MRVHLFYHLIKDYILLKNMKKAAKHGMHVCNPSTWEAEAGGSGVQGWPGLENKTCLTKKRKEIKGTALNSHSYIHCKTALGR
jgi:hypothetical protein